MHSSWGSIELPLHLLLMKQMDNCRKWYTRHYFRQNHGRLAYIKSLTWFFSLLQLQVTVKRWLSTSQISFVFPCAASLEISTGICQLFLKVSEHMDITSMCYTLGMGQNMKHSWFSRPATTNKHVKNVLKYFKQYPL